MAGGNRRIVQDDFSAGAFPATSFENIPRNGFVDSVNFLIEDDRSLKMRGGSRWAAPAMGAGSSVEWMWSGVIGGSTRATIVANSSRVAASDDQAGTTVTVAGGVMGWRAPAVSFAGSLYMPDGQTISPTLVVGAAAKLRNFYAVAGNRLWAANYLTNRVDFSDVGVPGTFGATSFHEIPEGGVLGLIGLRDAVVVFTTAGVWVISNVGMNLTDATGNVQHRIDRYSRDLILPDGGSNGLGAAYESALVVPARDGVYLMSYGVTSEAPQQFTLISRPISNLWQSYVAAGYMPGQPVVHRRTLFLPIRTVGMPGAGIDLLACRLDVTDSRGVRTFPWARVRSGNYNTDPVALARSAFTGNLIGGGGGGARLMTLDYFDTSLSTTDADGSSYGLYLQARSPVGRTDVATLAKFRMGYELDSPGAISAVYADNEGGSTFLSGTAPDNMADLEPKTWRIARRARFSSVWVYIGASLLPGASTAISRLVVRSLEWFVRDRGRV